MISEIAKPFSAVLDRRLEHFGQRHRAVCAEQGGPSVHGPGAVTE